MSLVPPPKVQKLQTALHAKAKGSPGYRFYRLYDKVYRRDILEFAYLRCRSNDGAPGVDGQTFEDIEAHGRELWLDELTTELRERTYRPDTVRRVFIPKGVTWEPTRRENGEGRRPWGMGVTPREATGTSGPTGVMATACPQRRSNATREALSGGGA